MKIRPFRESDVQSIAELINRFIRETTVHFGYEEISPEDVIETRRSAGDRFPWLVAEQGDEFLGYASSSVWRERAAYRFTAETSIYLVESARGRGIGATLYTALLDELRNRGFHSAVGGATMPNDASVRLHERVGFEYVGTFKEVGRKFDKWLDVGFWQIRL